MTYHENVGQPRMTHIMPNSGNVENKDFSHSKAGDHAILVESLLQLPRRVGT